MACTDCDRSLIAEKLGRCQPCMVKAAVLAAIAWGAWLALAGRGPQSIERTTALAAALLLSALLVAHGVLWAWYRFRGERSEP